MTIALITGTRPEIIKMYPIMKLFDSRNIDYKYIHTGQHYDYNLFLKFIEDFGIRKPDISITMAGSNPVAQVSGIMQKVGDVINKLGPSSVLVEGDTNSVLASALAALKSHTPIAHVESGLRSNDWKTVEEHNRRIVDNISDILFSPTVESTDNLQNEHVYGKIYTVGNTIIDAIDLCLSKEVSASSNNNNHVVYDSGTPISLTFDQSTDDFILVTIHRSENVDDANNLKQILMILSDSDLNYLFPMHPHTLKKMHQFGLTRYIGKRVKIIKPLGYIDFLKILKRCKFVITDSGGVQEEITSPKINKRALVLRDCTERPESVKSGHSILCKIDQTVMLHQIETMNNKTNEINNNNDMNTTKESPYGTGYAAFKIVEALEKYL